MSTRETFAQELKAFFKELIRVFPDDRDMKMMSSTLNIAMMDEPDAPQDDVMWRMYDVLRPFEDLIHVRDPGFFVKAQNIDSDVPLFSKLDLYWQNLNDANRGCVWDYIQVLYRLAKKAYATQ
jgi:hypothetical protein